MSNEGQLVSIQRSAHLGIEFDEAVYRGIPKKKRSSHAVQLMSRKRKKRRR
jgi:hypothetical protein